MAYGHQTLLSGLMPRRNILLPALCIVLLIAVWTFRLPNPSLGWFNAPSSATSLGPPSPAQRGNEIDLSDPEAPFIGWPLQRLCSETTWVDGLVYICDNNSGGIGNIRNYIQLCLRYGLEAGATGLVIPKIRKRNENDLSDLFTEFLPFSYMFDEKRFRDAFNVNCPQITLYDEVADIPGAGEKPNIEEINPKDYGNREDCHWQDQNRHTDRFGDTFRKWLHDGKNGAAPSATQPRLIRFKWGILFDWQVYRDGPEFFATFGSILKFNDQLIRLGKATRKSMQAFARSAGAKNGRFLGVHLRTESDALGFWPAYDMQSEAYLKQARKRGFEAAYLATGNASEAQKFSDGAIEMAQMKVVTKADLLKGKDLEELESLTWDQQGLVDCVVLLGSDFFVGTMPSSFSVYTAMKRHLRTGGLYTRPYKVGTEGDGLSYLVGNYEKYWAGWLFMWDGMWP
ncbi:Uu.00g024210.m01.CDS01 [Anthostomella pinea]|uniref:Uu.00g024210.m01.CDS01 n=1 Tax=Anthostomella pinea TaxID=933095 RepID=A0AAI8W096_9PEZI|nr:Uu.00g024210.m01.CDS01 [Anthostomella pinea]